MSAPQVGDAVRTAMNNNIDFIVVNFANGDMVGHTGIFDAAVKAVEAVDYELGLILEIAKKENYNIILTSDHGNCEMMRDEDGNTLTNHTVGDVYCFVISKDVKVVKTGSLNNIAPTIIIVLASPFLSSFRCITKSDKATKINDAAAIAIITPGIMNIDKY